MPHGSLICTCVGLLLALQQPYGAAATGSAVTIHITGPVRIMYGSPGGGTTQAPTAEQCNGEDGFCVTSGDRCNGTVKILHNSCDEHCSCCVPKKKDLCSSPWVPLGSSGCFMFVSLYDDYEDWFNARSKCQELGADLATLDTKSKLLEVMNFVDERDNAKLWNINFWVGGRRQDFVRRGQRIGRGQRQGPGGQSWRWISGAWFTEGWYKGDEYTQAQPDEADSDIDGPTDWCINTRSRFNADGYTLEDDPCTNSNPYICEKL